MSPRHIPNLLCVLRMIAVVPLVWLLLEAQYPTALALFLLAGFTDGLDGYLAKRFDWRSRLGGILDPLADKLLLVSSFATLAWIGLAPTWLFVAVVVRDLVIVSGATAYRLVIGPFEASPTLISKTNSAAQMLYVLLVVMAAAFGTPAGPILTAMGWVVLATTLASGIHYVASWAQRARRAHRPT